MMAYFAHGACRHIFPLPCTRRHNQGWYQGIFGALLLPDRLLLACTENVPLCIMHSSRLQSTHCAAVTALNTSSGSLTLSDDGVYPAGGWQGGRTFEVRRPSVAIQDCTRCAIATYAMLCGAHSHMSNVAPIPRDRIASPTISTLRNHCALGRGTCQTFSRSSMPLASITTTQQDANCTSFTTPRLEHPRRRHGASPCLNLRYLLMRLAHLRRRSAISHWLASPSATSVLLSSTDGMTLPAAIGVSDVLVSSTLKGLSEPISPDRHFIGRMPTLCFSLLTIAMPASWTVSSRTLDLAPSSLSAARSRRTAREESSRGARSLLTIKFTSSERFSCRAALGSRRRVRRLVLRATSSLTFRALR